MRNTFVYQNVVQFLALFLYLSVTITHAYNETTVNEMAAKLNMTNNTLLSLFSSLNAANNPANLSYYYNTTHIDQRFSEFNYELQQINSSIDISLGKLLTSLLDIYVNASISNASQKISPLIGILRDDMNIRFDALTNVTVRNYQLYRNITELNQTVSQYAFDTAQNVRYSLDNKVNWNFSLALFMSVAFPITIYLATTRIYSLRMKILGSVSNLRKYAIEDLNLNPLTREEIETRKSLKLAVIKTKCSPKLMKGLLNKVDTDEINSESDIDDYTTILRQEEELKYETDNKHKAEQNRKGKYK